MIFATVSYLTSNDPREGDKPGVGVSESHVHGDRLVIRLEIGAGYDIEDKTDILGSRGGIISLLGSGAITRGGRRCRCRHLECLDGGLFGTERMNMYQWLENVRRSSCLMSVREEVVGKK